MPLKEFQAPAIPQGMIDDLEAYRHHHVATGGFLYAVLANDLLDAVLLADKASLALLPDITRYVHLRMPARMTGSYDRVDEWLAKRTKGGQEPPVWPSPMGEHQP